MEMSGIKSRQNSTTLESYPQANFEDVRLY